MANRKSGLIVNISSFGGASYMYNVAYGVGKAAMDRLAADMAHELKPYGVTVVSLWPGAVGTEMMLKLVDEDKFKSELASKDELKNMFYDGESIEYAGKAVVALATDLKVLDKTGRVLITSDLGQEYDFKDIDGRHKEIAPSLRELANKKFKT